MLASEYYKLKETYRNCLIGGFFFLFILLAFFAVGSYMLALQIRAESYVRTEAVIVDYVVRSSNRTDSHGHSISEHVYFNVVEYEFDGQTYRDVCDTSTGEKSAVSDIGNKIDIFVNPKNPEDVLYRNSTHVLLITVSYVVSVIGFVVIALVFNKAHNIKKTPKKYDDRE